MEGDLYSLQVEGKSSAEFVIELIAFLGKTFLGAVDAVVQVIRQYSNWWSRYYTDL